MATRIGGRVHWLWRAVDEYGQTLDGFGLPVGLRRETGRGGRSRVTHTDPRAGDYAVAADGLSRRYGRESALEHVDRRVPDGAVYALVGASGAGKSTLFTVLMHLERPDAGTAALAKAIEEKRRR